MKFNKLIVIILFTCVAAPSVWAMEENTSSVRRTHTTSATPTSDPEGGERKGKLLDLLKRVGVKSMARLEAIAKECDCTLYVSRRGVFINPVEQLYLLALNEKGERGFLRMSQRDGAAFLLIAQGHKFPPLLNGLNKNMSDTHEWLLKMHPPENCLDDPGQAALARATIENELREGFDSC